MGRRMDVFLEGLLDFGGDAVGIAQQDVRGESEMQFDEVCVADIAVTQVVMGDAVPVRFRRDDFLDLPVDGGIGGVHQSAHAAPEQTHAGNQNVHGGRGGKKRIPVGPTGEHDQTEGDQHAEAGPAIGQHMMPVRFENDGSALFSYAHEVPAQRAIEHGRHRGEAEADGNVRE